MKNHLQTAEHAIKPSPPHTVQKKFVHSQQRENCVTGKRREVKKNNPKKIIPGFIIGRKCFSNET